MTQILKKGQQNYDFKGMTLIVYIVDPLFNGFKEHMQQPAVKEIMKENSSREIRFFYVMLFC